MRRRLFLQHVLAASGLALAGCAAPTDGTTVTDTPRADETGAASIQIRLQNEADSKHALALTITHTRTAQCWFTEPACDIAQDHKTIFTRTPTLYPGDAHEFDAELPLTDWIDTFAFETAVDGGPTRTLDAIEPDAQRIVGDDFGGRFEWRIERTNRLTATVVSDDGGISFAVGN